MLHFDEFKALCNVIGKQMSEDEFRQNIISNLVSKIAPDNSLKQSGLLLDGLKQFFVNEIEDKSFLEDFMYAWLENLGYDSSLNPIRSRCFTLSLHSTMAIDLKI